MQPPAGASLFHLLDACRAVDTRGGNALGDGTTRELALAGACGLPADAKSVVVNVTAIAPTGTGWLSLYAAGTAWPGTSTVNYRAGRTRTNGALVQVSPGARMDVLHSGLPMHIVIDVVGFFR